MGYPHMLTLTTVLAALVPTITAQSSTASPTPTTNSNSVISLTIPSITQLPAGLTAALPAGLTGSLVGVTSSLTTLAAGCPSHSSASQCHGSTIGITVGPSTVDASILAHDFTLYQKCHAIESSSMECDVGFEGMVPFTSTDTDGRLKTTAGRAILQQTVIVSPEDIATIAMTLTTGPPSPTSTGVGSTLVPNAVRAIMPAVAVAASFMISSFLL